ncbi:sigma-E processing peptidase SpoIIGA [Desulfofundulus sp. TPOSR]|uniref:sigma-E processing peptidase SpoIIGA n=1 Tax=Desulfofundulus sp. TPOSR TaxID=2714340 RepID=UPI00140E2B68|nr:sigma-E processing peptidase SpoIIGA [Desulfofundulus sp. TPOSR]NHM25814.1 sigma-E processing peptidase SpoIIGA [Desulfofundulus sp. TPOSR]
MTGYVVYVDQVLAGNLLLNYILLWTAGRLSQVRTTIFRLVLSSALGSVYALFFFVPGFNQLFSLPLKIFFSSLMVVGAFAPLPLKRLLACLVFFYLSSFALGGIWLGFIYFLYSNSDFATAVNQTLHIIQRYFWPGLLLALATLMGGGRVLALLMQLRLEQQAHRVGLVVEVEGRRVEVCGLVDTGNSLRDPLTGHPVIVVEYTALLTILPPAVRQIIEEAGDSSDPSVLAALAGTGWAARLCLIPFRSVGQEQGMLIGIRPDRVEILQKDGSTGVHQVVVGIYRHTLGSYQALVPPAVVKAA